MRRDGGHLRCRDAIEPLLDTGNWRPFISSSRRG